VSAVNVMKDRLRRSALLRARLQAFTRVLRGVEHGEDRAIHRARVASRRLRELIPVLQLPPGAARKLGRRLRKVTRRLGAVRELDVLLLLTDELHVSRPVHRDALRRVRHMVVKKRDERRRLLSEHLPVDDLWALARRLERMMHELREQEAGQTPDRRSPERARSVEWAVDARIAHRAARLARAIDGSGAVYLTERLHDVRIAVKKLRYALELRAALTDPKEPAIQTLKHAQALLGRMHDLQVLIEWVRGAQASLEPPNLVVWREMDALLVALDEACRRLHARYVRDRTALHAVCEKLQTSSSSSTRRSERRAG
jgi:CHAD domain-containing protein